MFYMFQLKNNRLFRINKKNKNFSIKNIVWIDIVNSNNTKNPHQNVHIHTILNQNKINFFKFINISKSKKFYEDKNGIYIHSFFFTYINNDLNQINNDTVTFLINKKCLYTIRDKNFPIFSIHHKSLHTSLIPYYNSYEILFNLFITKIDDIIEKLEYIYTNLTKISTVNTKNQKINQYECTLSNLTKLENIRWKIYINLLDFEKTINFLINKQNLPLLQKKNAKSILKTIKLLISHNNHILQKINSLTQIIMEHINIEQNRIIKIFSIIFLPPTLIASSYGMNFEFMPELNWSFGYPCAIGLMIITGLIPYLYFKYKHWL